MSFNKKEVNALIQIVDNTTFKGSDVELVVGIKEKLSKLLKNG